MRPPVILSLALLASVLVAPPARAQDEATLTTIRAMGEEGQALFEKGAYGEALDRFLRVDALVKRHTIGVYVGRCLERLGRLNEAAERYLAVTRMEFPPDLLSPENADKLQKQKDARAAAEGLRAKLLPRIPAVILQVEAPAEARVTIDGQPVSPALFGIKRSIDPGAHRVEARSGKDVVEKPFTIREAEVQTVPVVLQPSASPPPGTPSAPPAASPSDPPGDVPVTGSAPARRIGGFVGIGAGAVGVVLGAVAGGLAWSHRGELERRCGADLRCHDPSTQDLVSQYNGQRTTSTVAFSLGGVLLAAGVVLVATAPAPKRAASLSLFAGPGHAGVKGAF